MSTTVRVSKNYLIIRDEGTTSFRETNLNITSIVSISASLNSQATENLGICFTNTLGHTFNFDKLTKAEHDLIVSKYYYLRKQFGI